MIYYNNLFEACRQRTSLTLIIRARTITRTLQRFMNYYETKNKYFFWI